MPVAPAAYRHSVIEHPTLPLTTPDGQDVDIDVEIADLIEMCWALGGRTNWSCLNHREVMAVEPWSPDHLQALRQWYSATRSSTSARPIT